MPSTLSLINPLTQPITSKHASPNFCANTPPEQTSLQSQLTKHKPLTHLSPKPLPNPTSQPQQTWSPGNYPQNARQNCHHAHTNVPPTLLPQLHHTPTPAATPSPSTQPPSANPSPVFSAPSTLSPASYTTAPKTSQPTATIPLKCAVANRQSPASKRRSIPAARRLAG